MARFTSASIALLLLLCAPAAAHADDDTDDRGFDRPYFAPKLMFGLGGEGKVDFDLPAVPTGSDDLEPTYGVGLMYMHPMFGFFGVGGQLAIGSWISDAADTADYERSLYADLSVIPQVNIGLLGLLEVYGEIPIGLTLNFPGDDSAGVAAAADSTVGTGVGYHVGLLLGARIALSNSFGLLGELGILAHSFSTTVETPLGDADFDTTLTQFAINLGVYF